MEGYVILIRKMDHRSIDKVSELQIPNSGEHQMRSIKE